MKSRVENGAIVAFFGLSVFLIFQLIMVIINYYQSLAAVVPDISMIG